MHARRKGFSVGTLALVMTLALGCTRRESALPASSNPEPKVTTMPDAAPSSAFHDIALRVGMSREEAEKLIAAALGKTSDYSPYGNNLRGGTVVYRDDGSGVRLEVDYKPGGPAPWVMRPDGVAEHHPPVDESISSFRIVDAQAP